MLSKSCNETPCGGAQSRALPSLAGGWGEQVWADRWWGPGPGGGKGYVQSQPWWRDRPCTEPKLSLSWEAVIMKEIGEALPTGEYFYGKSKKAREWESKQKIKTAGKWGSLCSEEEQSSVLERSAVQPWRGVLAPHYTPIVLWAGDPVQVPLAH